MCYIFYEIEVVVKTYYTSYVLPLIINGITKH